MLEIKQVEYNYHKKRALSGVSLQLENGVYGLLGPNGAGKTTLLRCITGAYSVKKGEIRYNDISIQRNKEYKRSIGYLPQKFNFFKELSLTEAMQYFGNLKGLSIKQSQAQLEQCLDLVGLAEEKDNRVGSLSGGMLRRLGIAQALLGDSKILILDEPTAGLDPEERLRFRTIIEKIKSERIIIISTHIVADVEAICEKIIVMAKGKILAVGDDKTICSYAKDKIYKIPTSVIKDIKEQYYLEQEYLEEEPMCKIVTKAVIDEQYRTASTLEDGYICLVRGI